MEFAFKCQLLTLSTVPASGQGNRPAPFLFAGPLLHSEAKSTLASAQNACKRAMKWAEKPVRILPILPCEHNTKQQKLQHKLNRNCRQNVCTTALNMFSDVNDITTLNMLSVVNDITIEYVKSPILQVSILPYSTPCYLIF